MSMPPMFITQDTYSQIAILQSQLSSTVSPIGDWKIIKCYEAKLLNQPLPYDIEELMQQRQEVRDKINELQKQLKPQE